MSKHIYTTPACIVAGIDMEQHLLQTSRNSKTGNKETSTNRITMILRAASQAGMAASRWQRTTAGRCRSGMISPSCLSFTA